MKCLVCATQHEAAECPRCHFPDIQLMGDREKAMEQLMPTILAYRTNFLKNIRIELPAYRWKDHGGQIVADRIDWLSLGSGDVLMQQIQWLPEKFARIPDQKELAVTVRITAGDTSFEKSVCLPNLTEPQLQQLGAAIDENCSLRLLLRNETQSGVSSVPVPLFD